MEKLYLALGMVVFWAVIVATSLRVCVLLVKAYLIMRTIFIEWNRDNGTWIDQMREYRMLRAILKEKITTDERRKLRWDVIRRHIANVERTGKKLYKRQFYENVLGNYALPTVKDYLASLELITDWTKIAKGTGIISMQQLHNSHRMLNCPARFGFINEHGKPMFNYDLETAQYLLEESKTIDTTKDWYIWKKYEYPLLD